MVFRHKCVCVCVCVISRYILLIKFHKYGNALVLAMAGAYGSNK